MSVECFLALGSNLRTPQRQVKLAIHALRALPKTEIQSIFPFLITKPLSCVYQPKYCNTIIQIKTTLTPNQLLFYCQKIEKKQGRIRTKHWGSRTLDIDILTFSTLRVKKLNLTIPHPGILSRPFIYEPLFEKSPQLISFLNKT